MSWGHAAGCRQEGSWWIKIFWGGSDPRKKAVGPSGLGVLCACHRHSPAFYHAEEELILGKNIFVLFLLLIPPWSCWV